MGIFLPLFLFGGCQTVEQKTESQFDRDLRGLYSKVLSFGSQTRSGNGEVELTEEQLTEIFEDMATISRDNGISEIVSKSGYYQCDPIDFATADIYDLLQWFEANGTPEMYQMMLSLDEEEVTADDIINNTHLLPNEKMGLLLDLGILQSEGVINKAPNNCASILNKKLDLCRQWRNAGLVCVAFAYVIFGWGGATATGAAVMAGYSECNSGAYADYNVCMNG